MIIFTFTLCRVSVGRILTVLDLCFVSWDLIDRRIFLVIAPVGCLSFCVGISWRR